jgi:arylsulfate sulfotransferase
MLHFSPRLNPRLKKSLLTIGLVVVVLAAAFLLFLFLNPAYAEPEQTRTFVADQVSRQQQIDRDLRTAYQSGRYSFDAPLVVQDPYQRAPLTALAIFDTPEDSRISIHVPGLSPEAAVDFTFPGFQKHHEIPILGLVPGTLNHVTLSKETQTGSRAETVLDLQTEGLPVYLTNFRIDQVNRAKYNPGLNFAFQAAGLVVFDIDGNIRWYSTQASYQVFTKLQNGRFLRTYTEDQEGDVLLEEDLLGKIYAIYNVADGVHHDAYELPNGNFLITSSDLRSNTTKDTLIEVDRKSGHIVRSFDLKDILDPGRPHQVKQLAPNDWLHLNSIFYDPSDRSIILSSKGQSAVIKLSYPGMQIRWILGPHDNWSPKYQPYLLTPEGENFEWQWSQHHATLYTPDTGNGIIDLLLFDNGNYRSFSLDAVQPINQWYSMVSRYRIDETTRTVELVWEYGKELGSAAFSAARGSAYPLANGDVLGTWGDIYRDAQGNPSESNKNNGTSQTKIIEVDPDGNQVVFAAGAYVETYRTMRMGMYDGYSDANSYLSTSLNDTTGNDVFDRSVLAWRDIKRWTITPLIAWVKKTGRQLLGAIR